VELFLKNISQLFKKHLKRWWKLVLWLDIQYWILHVTVKHGSYHDVDSSELAFKLATYKGIKEAFMKAQPMILEPIMDVEVVCPQEYMGDIIGDVSSRRGMIEGQDQRGNAVAIHAKVPLSEMFGYTTTLRSITQGRGTSTMKFALYEKVPNALSEKIIAERKGKKGLADDE
jgi:elongation factor G